ncbi:hypothetical protein WCD74_14170 [Actinomycetospora sp. OC33-EN08]|uniref:Uncharacterized protein n=1 Tax=Actinomycetospora aurantiaca TaxID=3129233 RepID=A0ABU8MNM6_9PSEU
MSAASPRVRPPDPLLLERRWHDAGMPGPVAAVPIPGGAEDGVVGMVTEASCHHTVEAARRLAVGGPFRPAVVQFGGLLRTATGTPHRAGMARTLAVGHAATDGPDAHRTLADRIAARCRVPTVRVDLRVGDDPVHVAPEDLVLVVHGPEHDRWDVVDALLGRGAEVAATAPVRHDGRDLGGVVWARRRIRAGVRPLR